MKWVRLALLVILIVLSLATGITKLIQLPAEMELFRNSGWPDLLILLFGLIQLGGGLAIAWPRTRQIGCYVMIATFAIASVVVLISGMIPFFLFSLLFIVLAALPLLPYWRAAD